MTLVTCEYCKKPFPIYTNTCPHCGRPDLFPNVRIAELPEESTALERRYQQALADAASRGCAHVVADFEAALGRSRAVIACQSHVLERLAKSDYDIYATFDQQVDAEARIPSGERWDALRASAESALFRFSKKHVRYAALTLNDLGVANWGECFMFLDEEMIAHRASVLEENCILFMKHHDVKFAEADLLPLGYRAPWKERAKVCIAKLANRLEATTSPDSFPDILLQQGLTTADSRFVEIHIWGPISRHTLREVVILQQSRGRTLSGKYKTRLRAVPLKYRIFGSQLADAGVPLKALEIVK